MKHSIQIIFIVFVCTVLLWFLFDVFPRKQSLKPLPEQSDVAKKTTNQLTIEKIPRPLSLGIIEWEKDIFYDKSEAYKNLFRLTGISKMRDGYKAFINNEILMEGDRIRGFTVQIITEKKVVLKKNNSSVTLRL